MTLSPLSTLTHTHEPLAHIQVQVNPSKTWVGSDSCPIMYTSVYVYVGANTFGFCGHSLLAQSDTENVGLNSPVDLLL